MRSIIKRSDRGISHDEVVWTDRLASESVTNYSYDMGIVGRIRIFQIVADLSASASTNRRPAGDIFSWNN